MAEVFYSPLSTSLSYECLQCKKVQELKSKLQDKQSVSQDVITSKESNSNAGKKNMIDKGKERPDTFIVGDSIVRGLSSFREVKGESGKTLSIGGSRDNEGNGRSQN